MSIPLATWLVHLALLYLLVGAIFAVPFVWKGAGRIDADAGAGSWGFRLVIVPGVAALWPLLAVRWLRADAEREESSPHRRAARREGSAA